jgi:hypothetical protein
MSENTNNIEEVVEVPEVKPKRAYRSKFYYMTEEEVKAHKSEMKRKNNLKYKENHYDKIKEAQKRFFSSEKGRDYQRDYKRKEALIKKEAKLKEVVDV